MNIKKEINQVRRSIMRGITKNVGASNYQRNLDSTTKIDIKRVLICRPNQRLGNLLLITPLIQEITDTFPDCKIDLFVKGGLAPIVFENYKNIDQIIELPKKPFKDIVKYSKIWLSLKKERYDLVINIDKNSSSGRLSAQFANAEYKFFGDENEEIKSKHKDHEHLAKYPVYDFRYHLTKLGYEENDKPVPPLNLKLSSAEIANGKTKLNEIVNNNKKTICIFTFATGEKCYSESWWETFYERLKKEYSDYNIIEILPIENISKINFKAPTFYSKDVREMGSLMANVSVFIGADSGIMHLASASLAPTVGLFSVTNKSVYEPYDNNSIAINTTISGIDDWIKIIDGILIKN